MTRRKRHGQRVGILTSVHSALDTRVFHKQARTLAAAGYNVTLIAQHEGDCSLDGVRIDALPVPRSRFERPLLWWRILLDALRMRADAYHIHDPELLPLALGLRALTGAATIYDVHEYYADEVRTRQWIPRALRAPAAWATARFEELTARRLSAVVTVNEHMNAAFLRVQPRSIAVYNYPPAEYFAPLVDGSREQSVIYAGVMTRDRGLETIFRTGALLRRRFPELRIDIAGIVDWSGIGDSIPTDPEAWRNEAGVRFLGLIPQRDLPALLGRAAVGWIPFLATPNNIRSTPNKLLEYMAAALPVVASDFGYMGAIIREAACGLLAAAADPHAHAEQIASLLERPDQARAMGERGRAAVLQHYTWAAEGERLVALYDELLGVDCPKAG
jgi:glycosyltransferase involved in cell wall biosynthesis